MLADQEFTLFPVRKQSRQLEPDEVSLANTNILISAELATTHMKGVKRVVFVFDQEARVLGIRQARPGEHGYKLSCRSVSSSALYDRCEIWERGRFKARFEDGVLLVPLDRSEVERTGR